MTGSAGGGTARDASVSVIGLGKAGLPLAAVAASAGLHVVGVDTDARKIARLQAGDNPIPEEPGLAEALAASAGRITFTSEYSVVSECSAHIVVVPVFVDDGHRADFRILDGAIESLGTQLRPGHLVVLETTVPPGTTDGRLRGALEAASGLRAGADFAVAYSPERIMTGYSLSRYRDFPKVVGGIDSASGARGHSLYSQFCADVRQVSNSRTAEMIKVAEGVYRDVNISLANELLRACDAGGVDFWEMQAQANHEFCHIHQPGNVGGHCIPVYPWFLIHDYSVPLIETARRLNDEMVQYYADKVHRISDQGAVAVVGLAYREGVKEKAYTRSIPLIAELRERGYQVYGIDPLYDQNEIEAEFGIPQLAADQLTDMAAVVLMNRLPEFREILRPILSKVVDVKNTLAEPEIA